MYAVLSQEALNNDFLRFLLVHTEGHELDKLIVINTANCRLMDNLRLRMLCIYFRDRPDLRGIHNNRVALDMRSTRTISHSTRVKYLTRCVASDRTRYDLCRRALSI